MADVETIINALRYDAEHGTTPTLTSVHAGQLVAEIDRLRAENQQFRRKLFSVACRVQGGRR
jgi:hypothetical protein